MTSRSQLRHEAARARGRIDHRAGLVQRRIDNLMRQARALARSPAALPVAFVCGMLAGHLPAPDVQRVYQFWARLASQVKALQVAAGLI